jgi:hypothetical protein
VSWTAPKGFQLKRSTNFVKRHSYGWFPWAAVMSPDLVPDARVIIEPPMVVRLHQIRGCGDELGSAAEFHVM